MAERSGQAGSAPVTLGGARLPNARRGPVELGGLTLSEPPTLRVDAKGVVMQANAAAAAMIGATDPDRLGGAALRDLFAGQEPDLRLRRVDGGELPVRVVQTPVPGTGLHAVLLVDVSDLASAAAELREERRRLTDVQHVAGIASWEFDPATGKTVWSDSHYEILGIERGSVEPGARGRAGPGPPRRRRKWCATYWGSHQFSGEAIDIEYRIVRPDGDVRWLRGEARSTGRRGRPARPGHRLHPGHHRAEPDQRRAGPRAGPAGRGPADGQHGQLDAATCTTGRRYRSEVLRRDVRQRSAAPSDETFMPGVHPDDQLLITEMRDKLLTAQTDEPLEVEIRDVGERVSTSAARGPSSTPTARSSSCWAPSRTSPQQRLLERQLLDDRRRLRDAQRVGRAWAPGSGTRAPTDACGRRCCTSCSACRQATR